MEADIKVFDTLDSTNITLDEMAKAGAPEGTCVVAFCQRKGQGRSGRSFYSPKGGNLYMSFLIRPEDQASFDMITVYAAVATDHAIKKMTGCDCGIKWVNDIYRGGKKVCGIIAKAQDPGKVGGYVIVGIGINLYEDDEVPEDISGIYGSVFGKKCDLAEDAARDRAVELAGQILSRFAYFYDGKRDEEAVMEYRRESIVIGKQVEYISGDSIYSAKVTGIDDHAGIMLDMEGEIRTFRDGEIRIRLTDA